MTNSKPVVNLPITPFSLPAVNNDELIKIGGVRERWMMLFVYRGKHCPRCKRFLNKLNEALASWEEVVDIVVISSDTEEKAAADKLNEGSTALYGTARLWDDGLIDPRDTRKVLAFLLDICADSARRVLRPNSFGVARF